MTQLKDDRLDVMAAIDDATTPYDRRRASRIRRKVATQMTPWSVGAAAVPFGVVIEDISEGGVAVVHSEALPAGSKFLVTIPRKYHGPQVVECSVVRCDARGSNLFTIGMRATQPIEHVEQAQAEMTLTSKRTRLLFLVFGIVGICLAAFMPL